MTIFFGLFDYNMKANLPLESTKFFLGGMKAKLGENKKREFIGYVKGKPR